MSSFSRFTLAAALTCAVGCGAPDGSTVGGGGADGFGDDARPTAAERTGATGDAGRATMALSEEDRAFVQKASMANQMEVTLGNLAEDKAQHDEVKQYGEQLARDHQAANRELQTSLGGGDATLAQQPGSGMSNQPDAARGIEVPRADPNRGGAPGTAAETSMGGEMARMQQEMQQTEQKLEGATGQAFDRAYLDAMVTHHQQDIREFERAAQSDNPQIREFAERTLPTLRQHLERAQQLQQAIR